MKGFKRKQHRPAKSGKTNQQAVVGDVKTGLQMPPKKVFLILLAVLVVVGGGVYLLASRSSKQSSTSCSTAVLTKQTATDLNSPSAAVLKPTVDKIEAQPNYSKDINCVYVLMDYYIAVGDPDKARPAYDQLVALYTSREDYSETIRDAAGSPDRFKPILEMLEQQQRDLNQTSRIIQP